MVNDIDYHPRPTRERPLLGLTILVVEDSRYASDAIRLMALRSGARIRRADCIASAERHLVVYRPSVAIVDLGLPDGSGLDLISDMLALSPRVPVILGTSGADCVAAEAATRAAGADGFLPKPVPSLAAFQAALLAHLPSDLIPKGPRDPDMANVTADPMALREDLTHAMDLLALSAPPVSYLRRFLIGVARAAADTPLEDRAGAMGATLSAPDRRALRLLLSDRIQALPLAI